MPNKFCPNQKHPVRYINNSSPKWLTVSEYLSIFCLFYWIIFYIKHNITEIVSYTERSKLGYTWRKCISQKDVLNASQIYWRWHLSCLEIFYKEYKNQYVWKKKINFLYTLLFCFEILLSDDDELFSHCEVLNGKFISSFWWLFIKVKQFQ